MVRFVACGSVVVMCAALLAGWGCSGAPVRIEAPPIDAAAAGEEAMKQYDTNKDGKIAGAELDKAPALKAALKQIDTAGDGTITAEKITARIQKWQDSKVGRMNVTRRVSRKKGNTDEPLEGVTVTFEPEKFLGSNMPTCTGVTDKRGSVQILERKVEPGEDQAPFLVPPGFYLVRITGPGIPPKYNTQTTLGAEVAQDTSNYGSTNFVLEF
jgi:hypothetical protein